MPRFRVALHLRIRDRYNGMPDPNPFLAPMPEPGKTVQMSVREWEFEAKDEAEVRRLLREAENFPTVRGYTLRSIEQLPDPTPAESR